MKAKALFGIFGWIVVTSFFLLLSFSAIYYARDVVYTYSSVKWFVSIFGILFGVFYSITIILSLKDDNVGFVGFMFGVIGVIAIVIVILVIVMWLLNVWPFNFKSLAIVVSFVVIIVAADYSIEVVIDRRLTELKEAILAGAIGSLVITIPVFVSSLF